MTTALLQRDAALPTGVVQVSLDASGVADYDILAPAAWDALAIEAPLLRRAAEARAIVFGSLGQRHVTARATIERLWDTGPTLVFDVNLRPPFDDRGVVERSLTRAHIVKVNDGELAQLATWFALPPGLHEAAVALGNRFSCGTVCVTRASQGAALWHDGRWSEHPGFDVDVRDTVGAGDAFLAVLLAGLFNGAAPASILERANRVGAHVAAQVGAMPTAQSAMLAR